MIECKFAMKTEISTLRIRIIVAFAMRSLSNERQEFLTALFPIADMTREAHFPIIFPQIANGGGY